MAQPTQRCSWRISSIFLFLSFYSASAILQILIICGGATQQSLAWTQRSPFFATSRMMEASLAFLQSPPHSSHAHVPPCTAVPPHSSSDHFSSFYSSSSFPSFCQVSPPAAAICQAPSSLFGSFYFLPTPVYCIYYAVLPKAIHPFSVSLLL